MIPIAIIQSQMFCVTDQGLCAQVGKNLYRIDGLAVEKGVLQDEIKGYQEAKANIVHYTTIR